MNICESQRRINAHGMAVKLVAKLSRQLFCLLNDYPVRYFDRDYEANGCFDTRSETKGWWKSCFTRKIFYDLEHFTDDIKLFEKMQNWLTDFNDSKINQDAAFAMVCVKSKIQNRKEKAADEKITYRLRGLEESDALDFILQHRERLSRVNTYADVVTLDKTVIGALIEVESHSVDLYESYYEDQWGAGCADYSTGGHHADLLGILNGAYKNYSWDRACWGSLYEVGVDEWKAVGEMVAGIVREAEQLTLTTGDESVAVA